MTKLPKNEWEGYIDWLCDFEFDKMKLPQPDAVLYLDMPPALSRILLNKRYESGGGKMDIHETDSGYLEKCREAALYAADKLGWLQIHCATGLGEQQAALAVDKISQKILEIVLRII